MQSAETAELISRLRAAYARGDTPTLDEMKASIVALRGDRQLSLEVQQKPKKEPKPKAAKKPRQPKADVPASDTASLDSELASLLGS